MFIGKPPYPYEFSKAELQELADCGVHINALIAYQPFCRDGEWFQDVSFKPVEPVEFIYIPNLLKL